MRILFLTQYYPPETGAAPLRAYHFATNFVKSGHGVTVVTGIPNHPSGVKAPEYRWSLGRRETREKVRIVRCFLCSSPKKNFVTRMLNQISFMITAFFGGLWTARCDVILVSSPPLFLGVTAWLLGLIKGVPYVLDVRDYWPYAAVQLGQLRSRRVIRLAEGLESFLYRRAAKIVAVTPSMVRMMEERGIPPRRVELITNGADTDRFQPGPSKNGDGETRRSVLYSGTHGLVHGMEVILEAATLLRTNTRIQFLLVGDGAAKPSLMDEARSRGLTNVRFVSSQQPEQLVETIRDADVCLATTSGGSFASGTIPVKMFDYMACGRPVVAAVSGDARKIVEQANGGIVVRPGDAKALASAVRELISNEEKRRRFGNSGLKFVHKLYSRRALAQRMEGVLRETAADERRVSGSRVCFRRYLTAKYTFDAVAATLLLVLTSPLILLIVLLIKLDSPGPAIFTQRRIGVHSHEFTIYKFRTMRRGTPDLATDLMAPDGGSYVTMIGKILRKTSLDELPNVFNILKGDMTFVGPRPALYNQYELIDRRRGLRVDLVRSGLSGWAQINGRDDITLDEKVRLDQFYVENCSLRLDFRILLRTFAVVISSNGA
jgi:lipopolysaccharide/colanic/teichoic acid biosynthesis glycosyltransferase/glycosyltransferase involved in cell wall biosynthesis